MPAVGAPEHTAARVAMVGYDGRMRPTDDDERIPLGFDDDEAEAGDGDATAWGPDERDRDLIDGSWEQRYYSGQHRPRDWGSIGLGVAIVLILAMLLPGLLVFLR